MRIGCTAHPHSYFTQEDKTMKHITLPCLLLSAISLTACKNETVPRTETAPANTELTTLSEYNPKERYAALLWVETADPIQDAQNAIKQGNTQLWGYRSRIGTKLPGVADSKVDELMLEHGVKYASAMGDTVHGDTHLKLRLQFIDYAKTYNTIILK